MKSVVLIAAALLAPAPALAGTVYQLSRDDIATMNATTHPDAALTPDMSQSGDRRVHGEMGVAAGTGGYRSVYGSMVAPLGETGTVAIAVENSDFGNIRTRR